MTNFVFPTYQKLPICRFNVVYSSKLVEFFTIGVSVRLSDRSSHRDEQKKIIKNCPQWGWKPGPLDLQATALPTELSQHSVASLYLHGLYKVMLY